MAAVVFTSPKTEYQFYLKLTLEETKAGTAYSEPEFSYKLQLYSGGWNFEKLFIGAKIELGEKVIELAYGSKQWTLGTKANIELLKGTTSAPHNGSANMNVKYSITMSEKVWQYAPNIEATGTMPVTAYTKWTAVTSPSINYNNNIIVPGNNLTVSWSGASAGTNNAITGYNFKIRKGSSTGTEVYTETITNINQTNKTISTSSFASRGDILYATIQAIGSVSGYDGQINSNQVGRVNTLPAAPSASASGSTVTSASSIRFTVTAGADSDGQTRSLYYSLNGGNKVLFSSPLTISLNSGINSGSNKISFYTYDGLEFSGATDQNFTAIFAPQIGSKSIIHTYVKDMNGYTNSLVSNTTITYSLSGGSASSIDIKLKAGSSSSSFGAEQSVPTAAITFNASSKTATININQISTNILGYGQYFQIRFRLYDGTAYSDYTEWSGTGRRAKQPQLPSSITFSNDAKNSQAESNYFKSSVKVKATNSSTVDGYAQVIETIVIASYSNTSKTFVCSSVAGATINQNLDLASITANTSVDFYFQTKDNLGQVSKSSKLATLIKSPNLVYVGNSASVSITNLRPFSNDTDFIIYHSYGNIGNASTIAYTYKIQIGSNSAAFTPEKDPSDSDPNLRTLTLAANEIKNLVIGVTPNQTSAHSASIIITATDGFGSSLSLSAPFTVNFTEPPYFSNTKAIKIRHDFSIGNSALSTTTGIEVPVSISTSVNYNRSLQMFNAGEGIIFKLPRATDPNNDISEYLIYLARANVVLGQTAPNVSTVSFGAEPWIRIPYTTITKVNDSDYYYYRYNLPQFAKNEYLYFKVKVVDKTGNESEVRTYDSCIIGCRTVQPNFNVSNIKITRNDSTVNLEYKIKITDLGGSAPSEGWSNNYYNNYPNFERPGSATGSFVPSNYTPTVKLKVEIAPNQDFSSNVISVGTFTGDSPLLSFSHTSASASGFSGDKVYVRFTLSVSYGINSSNQLVYVNSTPQVYMQQGEIPTVAHRSHCVGINTKDLADDDVLVIQNYLGKHYVVLKNNDLNSQKIITVDLKEGTINGAIINGGTW